MAMTRRGKLGKERLELREVVRQAMLGQLAIGREDGNLGDAFVKVHADMYHRLASCSQGRCQAL
jgi:hypothetical protein